MTIRSIDMQVLVQKVSDISKIQQIHQNENGSRQQENLNHIMQQTADISKTVNKTIQSEAKLINRDKEQEQKKQKKKKNNDESQDKKESGHSGGIDITI